MDHEGDQSLGATELISLFRHLGVKLDESAATKIIMDWSDNDSCHGGYARQANG